MEKSLAKIQLVYNKGFKWYGDQGLHIKGYYYYQNVFYEKNNTLSVFRDIDNYKKFVQVVEKLNGCFTIVIEKNNEIWIASDISRSFPVFYDNKYLIISDNADIIRKFIGLSKNSVDSYLLSEMLLSRNTNVGKTVYKEIMQLAAGQTACITSEGIKLDYYYTHLHTPANISYTECYTQLNELIERVFSRLLSSIKDKKIVVPLSGGYDSRLIVSMLKKKNIKNVVCYTYGIKNDYEVRFSEKVAKELGYEWHFIEYTKQKWENFFSEFNDDVKVYFDDTHNHCNLPHIQDYIALEALIRSGVIDKENSVIIPGFCGDVPAGSFTDINSFDEYSNKTLVDLIFAKHYVNVKLNKNKEKSIKIFLENEINELGYKVNDYSTILSAYESWVTRTRLAMWVVNSVRVYEHFGLEWRMPLWDMEYLNYWYAVPNNYRHNCVLYRDWLFKELFSIYNIEFVKPENSVKNIPKIKLILISILRHVLIYISARTGKDFYKANNTNLYNEASLIIYKKIIDKKIFNYNSLSVHLMEQLWWCEKQYGTVNIVKAINTEFNDYR